MGNSRFIKELEFVLNQVELLAPTWDQMRSLANDEAAMDELCETVDLDNVDEFLARLHKIEEILYGLTQDAWWYVRHREQPELGKLLLRRFDQSELVAKVFDSDDIIPDDDVLLGQSED